MRIGIDCRTILNPKKGERAGVGHYTYYLVKHLLELDRRNTYVLFFDSRYDDTSEFEQFNTVIRRFPFSQYKKFLPFAYSHMLTAAFLQREKLDVYHSPANVLPYLYRGPSVVTVHDLAIYQHPEWFPRRQKFSVSVLVPRSLRRAKTIIAVSEATKKSITKKFHIPPERVRVIYEGMKPEKSQLTAEGLAHKYRLRLPYLLYVGTIEPRKNIERLIHAYRVTVEKYPAVKKYQLVLAGHRGWNCENTFKLIGAGEKNGSVRYLNYIPHPDKISLIHHATAFVFPSLFEGFGLPVLEAMALGTPVITSNTSSLPEVVGTAGLTVNPRSEADLTAAMKKVLSSTVLQETMRAAGLAQAKKFSWRKCAAETLNVYKEVAERSR